MGETVTMNGLLDEFVALTRRERKRVRYAEDLGPREAAESIDGLRAAFQKAREAFDSGDAARALALLREDQDEDA